MMTTPTGSTPTGSTLGRPTPGRSSPARGSTSRLPAATLLALARRGIVEAATAASPAERYATAHLAALRVAAAVLAVRARPAATRQRGRPVSAWVLLAAVAPELAEWAGLFAAGAGKRAAAEAGLVSAVSLREADDLVRDVEAFLAMVEPTLAPGGSQLLLACR